MWLNDFDSDGSRTLAAASMSAYYRGDDRDDDIFSNAVNATASPLDSLEFTPSSSGTVYLKVKSVNSNLWLGTFDIVYSTGEARPQLPFVLPSNAVPLTENIWANGEINVSRGGYIWHSFPVTSGTTYRIWLNRSDNNNGDGSKTLPARVSAHYGDGIGIFPEVRSAWNTPQTFTATSTGMVYLRVVGTSSATGTFDIVYSTGTTRPAVP